MSEKTIKITGNRMDELLKKSTKADEYEARNKELLSELRYLREVNHDLTWQRDSDEKNESKAEGLDDSIEKINYKLNCIKVMLDNTDDEKLERSIYEGYEQALIDVRGMLYKVKYKSGDRP